MAKYQGHKNWNSWNVSLWINNNETLYGLARWLVRSHARSKAAWSMLEHLKRAGITHTPDGAPYSVTTIRAAMRGM